MSKINPSALFVPWLTPEVGRKVEQYRAALHAHGHPAVPSLFVFFLFVHEDYRQALAEAQETTGRYAKLAISNTVPAALRANLSPADQAVVDTIASISDHVEERAIVGSPRDCRRRLAELQEEFGIEHLAIYLHAGARDLSRARHGLELFAREVMPEFG